ncbi:MAG: Radical [Verrucomicrobiales bacterium]|nr:Radical [Verrucomicrobiales bacterium]
MKSRFSSSPLTARGTAQNPVGRFERLEIVPDPPEDGEEASPVRTVFLRDDSQTILSWNKSPDIPFEVGLNPYRGCEHGCAYCFARPTHEYLGMSAGLDFESRIVVKPDAPELLRCELSKKSWQPQTIALSAVTDCYQPVERRLELTRRCLQVLAEFRNPVAVITKNHLITRDMDILSELAAHRCVVVNISVTTLDPDLAKVLEPRASPPQRRLKAIRELREAGIPVQVMMAPVIPGLTDHEMPALLKAVAEAGAGSAYYVPLRLPGVVAPLFEAWLERHAPGHREKVLNRIREMRGGKLYDAAWGTRMRGEGFFADQLKALFTLAKHRAGFHRDPVELSTASFRVPSAQMDLFDWQKQG